MADPTASGMPTDPTAASGPAPASSEHWISEINGWLRDLETASTAGVALPPAVSENTDNQLVQVRLGIASSLFRALQCKHAATAGHSLRVALGCSAWALRAELPAATRDAIEVAALLHDVGLIGAPDRLLLKSGALNADEAAVILQSRRLGIDILRHCCASAEILEIVEYAPAWYDGTRKGFVHRGNEIPLGARMIAIVEAFDAMTTDRVYRPALSQERAMTELFDCAGTQFDPQLVRQFTEFHGYDQSRLYREVAGRWLDSLDAEAADSNWGLNTAAAPTPQFDVNTLFEDRLLDNMYDAVVFIDAGGQVSRWNRGAERLTGIAGASVMQRNWHPDLLGMTDERGEPVSEADCPVACAIRSAVQSLRRLSIRGRTGDPVSVDTHAIPVTGEDGTTHGAVLLFHDASSEISLERRCQMLHEKATKDPLTQVANRAEFDRVHTLFVDAHQRQQVPCSLLICDLDRFKLVNDTFGHQAGDDVIISLAKLLKSSCRPGDLVARYGGEEFVVLCADCDNAAAAQRADAIRQALSRMPQPRMDGRPATVSFGVTEVQPGDSPETMLRRADRALLMAKDKGRNTVVQLGAGAAGEPADVDTGLGIRQPTQTKHLLEQVLVTPVPIKMAIEKLRGFVADHEAKVVKINGDQVRLEIADRSPQRQRRGTDRPVTFRVDLEFEEERRQRDESDSTRGGTLRTKIKLCIAPRKNRDRRRDDVLPRAREVLVSFRSYLMATVEGPEEGAEDAPTDARRWMGNSPT